MNRRECLRERCRFWHLKGTIREQGNRIHESNHLVHNQNYETQRNKTNTQQYARPQYNQHPNPPMANYQGQPVNIQQGPAVNGDFLGQMREQINKDMVEIRKQQEMFMTRISQQMQLQIQQLQRPNLINQENQVHQMQPQPAQHQMQPQPVQQIQYHQGYPQMQPNGT